jgi:hypothetical protein
MAENSIIDFVPIKVHEKALREIEELKNIIRAIVEEESGEMKNWEKRLLDRLMRTEH